MDKYTKGLRVITHERKVTQMVNIYIYVTNDLDKKTMQDIWTNKTTTMSDNTRQIQRLTIQDNMLQVNDKQT